MLKPVGMILQIPALFFIAQCMKNKMPRLYKWTMFSLFVNSSTLLLLCLQPFIPSLQGGLLQQILYGSVFVWSITAIVLGLRKLSR